MSRRVNRVDYHLDTRGVKKLGDDELRMILRAADSLIMSGGRTMLCKILRGSREKKLVELGLDHNPAHGYYRELKSEEVMARIDRAIVDGYLDLEYDYRVPLLMFAPKGWSIERETYAEELLRGFDEKLEKGPPFEMEYLKDRNRGMILLLLDKVEATGNTGYIPLLEAWAEVDYKKVRARIHQVIRTLAAD